MNSYAHAPHCVRVVEVVLVDCERGEGDRKRPVLQVWAKDGVLLAEHDRIHHDPEYAAYFLRDHIDAAWLEVMDQAQAPASQALAAAENVAVEVAHV